MQRVYDALVASGLLVLVLSYAFLVGCQEQASVPSGAQVTPGVCGDGQVNAGEVCDDGNTDDGDLCASDCTLPLCLNGAPDVPEECDDGDLDNENGCRNDCTLPECVTDPDCSGGQICLSTLCQDGCRTNGDCAGSEVCADNACEPECSSDAGCPAADERCDVARGSCVKACRNDVDCPSGTICRRKYVYAQYVVLRPVACSCAAECADSEICTGGTCLAVDYGSLGECQDGCRDVSDCDPGEVCTLAQQCAASCANNGDCCATAAGNLGDTCVAGECVDACTNNADCGLGTICGGSTCTAGCEDDDDCELGLVCSAASCVGPPCGDGSKCVFVTNGSFDGNLGGLDGGDQKCQDAANAGLAFLQGKTFKAWLSDTTTGPDTRLAQAAVPYVRTDGLTVANDWADLIDGTLANRIQADEFGGFPGGTGAVWSNTLTTGAPKDATNCTDWTSNVFPPGLANIGSHFDTGAAWTDAGGTQCNVSAHLYCFEQ